MKQALVPPGTVRYGPPPVTNETTKETRMNATSIETCHWCGESCDTDETTTGRGRLSDLTFCCYEHLEEFEVESREDERAERCAEAAGEYQNRCPRGDH